MDLRVSGAVTSHLMSTFARVDLAFERGEGCWLIGTDGERYLDFASGVAVNALGHAVRDGLVKACDLLCADSSVTAIVIAAQQQANDSINNIQLEQQPDDNIIPVAPHLDDIPHEQPITGDPKPVVTKPANTIPSSNEKPGPILPKPVANKTVVTDKKIADPAHKPFWLQAATTKPVKHVKTSPVKASSTSHEKPNPIPVKKAAILQSATAKKISKPVNTIKTAKTIIQPKAKPKTVVPANDY